MSTALINLPVIKENNQLTKFLDTVKQTMIPLVPEMMNFVKPELKLGFQKITVETTFGEYTDGGGTKRKQKSNRDIYEVDGGRYSLHLSKLNEIAQAAGLKITDSKPIERQNDPKDGRVSFIKHQMKWELRAIDGSIKSGAVTGEYSYEEDKHRNFKEAQINKRRNFAGSLAESNCMARVINKAISKLPQSFTLTELKKPFLVPCVIEDYSEMLKKYPEMEKAYIAQKIGLAGFLMSTPEQLSNEIHKAHEDYEKEPVNEEPKADNKEVEEAQFTETTADKIKDELHGEEIWIDPNMPEGFDVKEWHKIQAENFKDVTQKERTEAIEKLIKSREYKRVNNTPIEQYPVHRQIELIFKLRCMRPVK